MPLARHDTASDTLSWITFISTHMPLARHDFEWQIRYSILQTFLLTCLLRGMTIEAATMMIVRTDFYSHASCEAWRRKLHPLFNLRPISTHMPLARHDKEISDKTKKQVNFYSHASCEAWRSWIRLRHIHRRFLLTCLLRGMTMCFCLLQDGQYISTHMPLARHDQDAGYLLEDIQNFYSHASCEAWLHCPGNQQGYGAFLLTCLLRGMTLGK